MNTTRDPKSALLEHAAPPRTLFDDVHDLSPTFILAPWEVPSWSWRAEHLTRSKQPVTGGIAEVRMLVRAIDGAGWPWTVVMNGDNSAWFQVLGTAEACLLEVATQTSIGMLARTHDQNVTTHVMSPECRFWVPTCLTDELFTAEEAAEIGIGFLTGAPLPDAHTVRRVHLGDPESRN
ncbi:hypothetical protein [Leucobacter sp. NPDC077196]|uniref:hypothetical protein n=1 Tax=Leucobacter sp. NPDC077196 TaxID=3154959 RepID=UPI00341E45FE